MEIRANLRRVPTRPLVFFVGILLALALGVVVWFALTSSALSQPSVVNQQAANTADAAPDYRDRITDADFADLNPSDAYSPRDPLSARGQFPQASGSTVADPYSPIDPPRH